MTLHEPGKCPTEYSVQFLRPFKVTWPCLYPTIIVDKMLFNILFAKVGHALIQPQSKYFVWLIAAVFEKEEKN